MSQQPDGQSCRQAQELNAQASCHFSIFWALSHCPSQLWHDTCTHAIDNLPVLSHFWMGHRTTEIVWLHGALQVFARMEAYLEALIEATQVPEHDS